MWLSVTPAANMWTATITEEAWKKMGSWSLSETPSHRSPHDDDGGHGPAPHPVIKTERLAHYYK